MNKKEKHILNIKFMYEYYEDDITERYIKNLSTNVILDNDCFDIEPLEKIYVTPFKKYHQLDLYKSVINDIKHILNNQMDYRDFVDIVNDIEEILERVNK